MDFRGYLGSRGRRRVLGRWKDTDVRTFRDECECEPFRTAFLAVLAFETFADFDLSSFVVDDLAVAR
jgi:hypothetical protein